MFKILIGLLNIDLTHFDPFFNHRQQNTTQTLPDSGFLVQEQRRKELILRKAKELER